MNKVWMNVKEPIHLTLNKERGHSITIIGGISNRWTECKYLKASSTNKEGVCEWLRTFKTHIEFGAVWVLDNHAAHHSNDVK
jgi:hypothetical protein